jgi:HEPN domain-containing protein
MSNVRRARDFVMMAREDMTSSQASSVPSSTCFHAQQAVEKYLKAFLVFHDRDIPKSHDIGALIDKCSAIDASLSEMRDRGASLTKFAVGERYAPSKQNSERECSECLDNNDGYSGCYKARLPAELFESA